MQWMSQMNAMNESNELTSKMGWTIMLNTVQNRTEQNWTELNWTELRMNSELKWRTKHNDGLAIAITVIIIVIIMNQLTKLHNGAN